VFVDDQNKMGSLRVHGMDGFGSGKVSESGGAVRASCPAVAE
jgi:hypothetical protein